MVIGMSAEGVQEAAQVSKQGFQAASLCSGDKAESCVSLKIGNSTILIDSDDSFSSSVHTVKFPVLICACVCFNTQCVPLLYFS